MGFDVKSEILAAIAKTDDSNMKSVLLLMLGVFENIGGKLDNLMRNEDAMRSMVLNGHAPVHHDHHQWIEKKIKEEDAAEKEAFSAKTKMRYSIIERVIWALLLLAVGSHGWLK